MGIAVLGPLLVNGGANGLAPRDRVVLEALSIRPKDVVSAEQLAEALWPDTPPATWSKVVQGSVVRLRKLLGAGSIETVDHGYRLTVPRSDLDSLEFERLVSRAREQLTLGEPERATYTVDAALGLWRGRPLADLEEWEPGRVEAERLEELRRDAEELRLEAALRTGRHRDVLAEARRRVEEAPLYEIDLEGDTWYTEFSADGDRLYVLPGYSTDEPPVVQVFDVATGREVDNLGELGHPFEVSPDGSTYAHAKGNDVVIADSNGQEIRRLRGPQEPNGRIHFSPDGGLVAAASEDGTVTVWNTTDGTMLERMPLGSTL
jgi:DNA-binding winged helix-turn-helix (wHTH) protein